MEQVNSIHTLFENIDQFVHHEAVTLRDYNDEEKAELFAMLSEHYGQLADQYSLEDTDTDSDEIATFNVETRQLSVSVCVGPRESVEAEGPYADQEYCNHCGSELAYRSEEDTD